MVTQRGCSSPLVFPSLLHPTASCPASFVRSKLDDTEFRNPFDRAYVRLVEDRDGGRGGERCAARAASPVPRHAATFVRINPCPTASPGLREVWCCHCGVASRSINE